MNITEELNSISTAECKTNMNITEKLNSTSTTEYKTNEHYWKSEQHFC